MARPLVTDQRRQLMRLCTPPAGFEPATIGLEVTSLQVFCLHLRGSEFSQVR